ncbi:MAG: hypothetical protein ACI8VC_002386 [Candidatus Endobugula sp.]|jgi:hypothetical protein
MKNVLVMTVFFYFLLSMSPTLSIDLNVYRGDQRTQSFYYPNPSSLNRGLLLSPSANDLVGLMLRNPERTVRLGLTVAEMAYSAAESAILQVRNRFNPEMGANQYESLVGEHVDGLSGAHEFLSFSLNPQIAAGYAVGRGEEAFLDAVVYQANLPSHMLTVARNVIDARGMDRAFMYPDVPDVDVGTLVPEAEVLITGGVEIIQIFTSLHHPLFINSTPSFSLHQLYVHNVNDIMLSHYLPISADLQDERDELLHNLKLYLNEFLISPALLTAVRRAINDGI